MKAININAWEIENNDGETLVFMTPEQFDFIQKHKEKTEQEIERLNNNLKNITKLFAKEREQTNRLNNIIKEAREYIEENRVKATNYFNAFDGSLCMDKKYVDKLLEILDKGE